MLPAAFALVLATDAGPTLVGDWEPPSALAVVYTDAWPHTFAGVAEAAAAEVPVVVLVEADTDRAEAEAAVAALPSNVILSEITTDSAWIRDFGPLQARQSDALVWLDMPYATARPLDDAAPSALAELFGRAAEPLPVSFDGGALASNGEGLCATTEDFLEKWKITPAERNELVDALGCRVLARLPALAHETTKHVDLFLQFAEPTVAMLAEFDPHEARLDAARMDRAAHALTAAAADAALELTIVRVPVPAARWDGYRPYVNLVRLPDRALVPTFADVVADREAAAFAALQDAMPAAELVGIPADPMRGYGGALHCMTLPLFD